MAGAVPRGETLSVMGQLGDPIWADCSSLTPPSPVSPEAGDDMCGIRVCVWEA